MIFIVTIVVLQVTVVFRTVFREIWIPGSAPLSWQLTQVLAGVLVIFLTSGFGAWRAKDRELQANFTAEIQLDQIEAIAQSRQVATLALESAQILHGAVQTRLVACAMMIEQASRDRDETMLNLALEEALSILQNPLPGEKRSGSVTDEVSRKTALWDGLCECDINISPEADITSPSTVITLGRVVEEGISNAIRHGQATHITITITMSPESNYQVCLQDNGRGPTKSTPGMGSAYLTQVSDGQWSVSASPRGSDLLVLVLA
jgi:signal transduction histidine kinase